VVDWNKKFEWIYRFGANPGMAVGRLRAAHSGLGPGSALRSRPRVALSSAQASSVYLTALWLVHFVLLAITARFQTVIDGPRRSQ
jgi:hypothetical protein